MPSDQQNQPIGTPGQAVGLVADSPGLGLAAAAAAAQPLVGQAVVTSLADSAPAFGNVLAAIGAGIADSQAGLDNGVVSTVNRLKGVDIEIITDVTEILGDDGLPDPAKTRIVTEKVSVLNFFTPTFHEWTDVSIAMDVEVSAFHLEQGLQFKRYQSSTATSATMLWGFFGWFGTSTATSSTTVAQSSSQDVRWQSGQVRVDAQLGPRRTSRLATPETIQIGPQIYVSQGAITEAKSGDAVIARTIDVEITLRKADGSANPGKIPLLDPAGLLPSFPEGSATDANGRVKATLTRNLTPGFGQVARFDVVVSLGQIRRGFTVTL